MRGLIIAINRGLLFGRSSAVTFPVLSRVDAIVPGNKAPKILTRAAAVALSSNGNLVSENGS